MQQKINISALILLVIIFIIVGFQGVRGINEYNKRFNYISKRIKCYECSNSSLYDSSSERSEAIKNEIKLMLKEDLSNHDILQQITLKNKEYISFDPENKIKLNLIIISTICIAGLLYFAFKFLY